MLDLNFNTKESEAVLCYIKRVVVYRTTDNKCHAFIVKEGRRMKTTREEIFHPGKFGKSIYLRA